MGLLSLTDLVRIIKKYFLQITALSLACGLISGYVVNLKQTYTCTLGFKYNHKQAEEGLAPDGESKLDPYEIQNPVIIKSALKNMGIKDDNDRLNANGIRQDISITKVITDLDKEVSESAALLGEKYDIPSTEYEMKFSYDASLGDEFGPRMFSNIIKAYDEFFLSKYYNKKSIPDFAKIVKNSSADYIVIADSMSDSIDSIIETLDELSGYYPDYRSQTTGYTFAELSVLYQHLREIQYAKFYGNIRAGNLAKDKEMVIKGYQAKIKDLEEEWEVNYDISENYKNEIKTFYDSYKLAGLYKQAEKVQQNVDSTNNKDQDVLQDKDLEDYKNTYDEIVLNYVNRATNATDASHSIDYYKNIIDSYLNDNVAQEFKEDLIAKNNVLIDEIEKLSAEYSVISNRTINELYSGSVNSDIEYLILPEVTADKPVTLIAIFIIILVFGMLIISVIVYEIVTNNIDTEALRKEIADSSNKKKNIDTSSMDELHQLVYQQYLADFSEFYLVYQSMYSDNGDQHKEAFIRWESSQLGLVSPAKTIRVVCELGIFNQLNDWIICSVCKDLAKLKDKNKPIPVVHINCPYSEVNDFALNDSIVKHTSYNKIPTENLCFELAGKDISSHLEYIMLLEQMGVKICIDKFENSDEDKEILSIVKPDYIKMSLDILNSDIYATSDDDMLETSTNMMNYFAEVIEQCHKSDIKACICGIENKSQDELATKMSFDFRQGYYYSKPEKLL